MSTAYILYIMGFAGAGKTTLVSNFSKFLEKNGYRVAKINLDPGAETLPYTPDYDVREIVKLRDIMVKENLGPNGGLIRSVECLIEKIDEVIPYISGRLREVDWMLMDTTGQLELFAFRGLGERLTSVFRGNPSIGIFLVDVSAIKRASDIVMSQLISLAIQLKLNIDTIVVINKFDLVDREAMNIIDKFYTDIHAFKKIMGQMDVDTFTGMSIELVDVLEKYMPPMRLIPISAKTGRGFDELYDIIHEVFCVCGDLT